MELQGTQWCEISNACTCTNYDEDTDTETPSEHCYGDCHHNPLDIMWERTNNFFEGAYRDKYSNLPQHNGNWYKFTYRVEYYDETYTEYHASTVLDFLQDFTYRISDWRIEYRLIHNVQSNHQESEMWEDEETGEKLDAFGEPWDNYKRETALQLCIYHHDAPTGFMVRVFKRPYVG